MARLNTLNASYPLPWWGGFVLLPGLAISGYVLVMAGGDVLSTGYWGAGMMWGLGIFVVLGVLFWLSRLSAPGWALAIISLFYAVLMVGSQVVYYDGAQDRLYHTVQAEPGRFPPAWKDLDRDRLYQQWMAKTLDEPEASGWWAHLRAQARAGIWHTERASKYEPGKPAYRPVYRQGWQVWLGWISSLLMAGVGCLFSLVGCAVWNSRVQEEERVRAFARDTYRTVGEALEQRGLSRQQVESILRQSAQSRHLDTPIPLGRVAALLPDLDAGLVRAIRDDLDLNRQWRSHWDPDRTLDPDRRRIAEDIIRQYYPGRKELINPRTSWLPLMIAAQRLHEAMPAERFWFSLKRIFDTLLALGHRDSVASFAELDLSGLSFRRVPVGERWASLATPEATFYARGSSWEALEQMSADEIPEEAYLGIIYQYYYTPDPRVYEMWWGTEPADIVARLGPRLRDALLTFIEMEAPRMAPHWPGAVTRFASIAGDWPFEVSGPILERALQAGWHQSLTRVPNTPEWLELLERYAPSPFGDPRTSVRWYDQLRHKKRREASSP